MRGILLLFAIYSTALLGQVRTYGLFHNSEAAFDGYTLFSPIEYTSTYLINNCGEKVHEWKSTYNAGLMAYLMPDGKLLRSGYLRNSTFGLGIGLGGVIEIINHEDEVEWTGFISNNQYVAHHDIEPMENGNILVLAYEKLNSQQALDLGRDPNITSDDVYATVIFEVRPVDTYDYQIVWEWHALDHLIQDFDSTLNDFGKPNLFPRKIDFNFVRAAPPVWIHANGIDYNEVRDEIVISSRTFNELWVIDHSTTIAEAASDVGGQRGFGGDLNFRWGNPTAYGASGTTWLEGPHDAQWIEPGNPGQDNFLVYNNRLTYAPSQVIELVPVVDANGHYLLNKDGTFEPDNPSTILKTQNTSTVMSGAQRLPNGNTLTCSALHSDFIELDSLSNEVWKYRSPVTLNGPENQGVDNFDWTFKIRRYASDDPRLDKYILEPQGLIELNPIEDTCKLFPTIITSFYGLDPIDLKITFNSMVEEVLYIQAEHSSVELSIFSTDGRQIFKGVDIELPTTLQLGNLQTGVYILIVSNKKNSTVISRKFLKL